MVYRTEPAIPAIRIHVGNVCALSWLGLSEQELRVDKWNICLVHAAAICGSQLK
jgi:hypothetical protein